MFNPSVLLRLFRIDVLFTGHADFGQLEQKIILRLQQQVCVISCE